VTQAQTRPGVFLDRDGTLIADVGYAHRPDQLRLLPGVRDGLAQLKAAGVWLIVVTNQSGVARGFFDEDAVHRFHGALNELLGPDAAIDAFYHCPFHPDAVTPEYRSDSRLRKPDIGMYELAAAAFALAGERCYMVGDRWLDMEFGRRAGLRSCLVKSLQHEDSPAAAPPTDPPFLLTPDFASAVASILDHHAGLRDAWRR
jgi:D-glycero-D-manno-heptose 1,7-bisphosphate phosphatase